MVPHSLLPRQPLEAGPERSGADHPANRTVLRSMLESMLRQTVCVFECANDGREAVDAAARRRYALILMVLGVGGAEGGRDWDGGVQSEGLRGEEAGQTAAFPGRLGTLPCAAARQMIVLQGTVQCVLQQKQLEQQQKQQQQRLLLQQLSCCSSSTAFVEQQIQL